MRSAGPAAYPNILGDGTPLAAAADTAEAPGTLITTHHIATIANATARSHDRDQVRPRPLPRPDNQADMLDSQ